MTDINKGNSYLLEISLFDASGNTVDINSAVDVQYVLSKSVCSANLIQKDLSSPDINIEDADNGIVTIRLTNAETEILTAGRAYHEAVLIDSASNYTTILCEDLQVVDKKLF